LQPTAKQVRCKKTLQAIERNKKNIAAIAEYAHNQRGLSPATSAEYRHQLDSKV